MREPQPLGPRGELDTDGHQLGLELDPPGKTALQVAVSLGLRVQRGRPCGRRVWSASPAAVPGPPRAPGAQPQKTDGLRHVHTGKTDQLGAKSPFLISCLFTLPLPEARVLWAALCRGSWLKRKVWLERPGWLASS
ncbi:hypothetical protein E5288_WYG008287 [Bos mutus]|uniref:Uncharacterized protein n=1 Tax=Bos mutus TaxID=72004 RepID=A0A6B0RXG3_9CETA|nr:hypothetical protein [Bos mutus]